MIPCCRAAEIGYLLRLVIYHVVMFVLCLQHLQSIEMKIVEDLAWQSGSPLFDIVKSLGGNLLMSPTRVSEPIGNYHACDHL